MKIKPKDTTYKCQSERLYHEVVKVRMIILCYPIDDILISILPQVNYNINTKNRKIPMSPTPCIP